MPGINSPQSASPFGTDVRPGVTRPGVSALTAFASARLVSNRRVSMQLVRMRLVRTLLVLLTAPLVTLIGATAPASAEAQSVPGSAATVRGSRLLLTDHWSYDAISRLRVRGLLSSLDPLSQPYTRDDVARAVQAIPAAAIDTLPRHVQHWMRLLRDEFRPELNRFAGRDSVSIGFQAIGGVVVSSSQRLDPQLPLRNENDVMNRDGSFPTDSRVWANYGVGGWGERGRFAVEARLFQDRYLRDGDPDGRDPGGIWSAIRTDQSYATVTFGAGSFSVGRYRRNWAPIGTGGLMISDNALAFPQLSFEIGGRSLRLRSFVGELDTLHARERYIVAHHLEYQRENFAISIGESKVYITSSGPRLANLNPLEIFAFATDRQPGESTNNTALDGQLWWRRGRATIFGEAFLDDIYIAGDVAPLRGAVSGGARFAGPARWMELGADYRTVLAYTYWTFEDGNRNNDDQWSYYQRGLGDNFSDYDRLSLHASLFPNIPGLRLTPRLQLQRKGEGDFRMPSIPASEFQASRSQFLGTAEKSTRFSLAGRYQPTRLAFFEWDAGMNFVRNANHEPGRTLREFSGVARLGLTWSSPRARGQ